MPSFEFSIEQPPAVSKGPTVSKPPGRVWEGATAPLPIKNQVSEANAFFGGVCKEGVIHRRGTDKKRLNIRIKDKSKSDAFFIIIINNLKKYPAPYTYRKPMICPLYLPENRRPAPYTYRKIDDLPPIPTGKSTTCPLYLPVLPFPIIKLL